jgi:hypothetical protein
MVWRKTLAVLSVGIDDPETANLKRLTIVEYEPLFGHNSVRTHGYLFWLANSFVTRRSLPRSIKDMGLSR